MQKPRIPNLKMYLIILLIFIAVLTVGIISYYLSNIDTDNRSLAGTDRYGAVHINLSQLWRADANGNKKLLPDWEKREQLMKKLRSSGVKYGREVLNWNTIANQNNCSADPSKNVYDWSEMDRVFALYKMYGIEPVVFFLATPIGTDTSTGKEIPCSTAPAGTTDPAVLRSYPVIGCRFGEKDPAGGPLEAYCPRLRNFLKAAVSRYGYTCPNSICSVNNKRVKYWEIWNEPELSAGEAGSAYANDAWWRGTVEDYNRMMRVSYNEIKKTDPKAIILNGGFTHVGLENTSSAEYQWIRQLLTIQRDREKTFYFDIFNIHDYTSNTINQVNVAKSLMNEFGFENKPLWITEISRGLPNNTGKDFYQNVLLNKYNNLYTLGVDKFFWFMASDMCKEHMMDINSTISKSGLFDCNLNPNPVNTTFTTLYHK